MEREIREPMLRVWAVDAHGVQGGGRFGAARVRIEVVEIRRFELDNILTIRIFSS